VDLSFHQCSGQWLDVGEEKLWILL
jgi:hypothetical protein